MWKKTSAAYQYISFCMVHLTKKNTEPVFELKSNEINKNPDLTIRFTTTHLRAAVET